LGGRSLTAVSLFAKIQKEFGRRLPLSTLLRAPTVEELARELSGESNESQNWACLVPIQPRGSRPPLFLVHGAGGNVLLYRALAEHLHPDQPLYGLQSKGLDGQNEPLKTIEEMAIEYLREVRKVQPHGPYYLGGYCLGGTVAYEMAQILTREGETAPMIAMLDTYNFSRALKVNFGTFLFEKVRFHFGNFTKLRPRDMWDYVREKMRVARDGELANLLTSAPGSSSDDGVARAESGVEASVQACNDHAADNYLPTPYAGSLTLFKPQINYKFYPDPKMGWGDLALGGLDMVELPMNPHAMLVEPFVKTLAAELTGRLEKLQNGTAAFAANFNGSPKATSPRPEQLPETAANLTAALAGK
jgi:thioesterase domain-containing protein